MAEGRAAPEGPLAGLCITVVVCTAPGQVHEWQGLVPEGASVADALRQCGAWQDGGPETVGIWGRAAPLAQRLRKGDRVEVYRPLTVDPKTARRERFARQGARSAGLFARKR